MNVSYIRRYCRIYFCDSCRFLYCLPYRKDAIVYIMSTKVENWVLKNKKADFDTIGEEHGISQVLARLLVNRGLVESEDIKRYLNPKLSYLYAPDSMKDIGKACEILKDKIEHKKRIRIVGDYDIDGIAATYILYTALKTCNAQVDYEIPDRIKDGYGINLSIIEEAYKDGIDTIITCDNGIAAENQIKRGLELGMTIIVTDHHDIPFIETDGIREYKVPSANAVVNPKQENCPYPFKEICGAFVAFKLIQILYKEYEIEEEKLNELIEITAIATVCDVMDLINENRIIVREGLKLLRTTSNFGLQALMEINNIIPSRLSAYHLGFILGPCLNASGRLDSAKKGLGLLLAAGKEEAKLLAEELKALNDTRKSMTLKGFEDALKEIETTSMKEDKVLVLYLNDCHESIAGIIAGRLKEKYNKPAIVLTGSKEGVKGSARSIEAYNIYEELHKCKDLLTKFGGHPMAAGLSLVYENVPILRAKLNSYTTLTEEELIPKVVIDVVLPFGYVSEELVEELEELEPFGKGNTKPLFAERNLTILKASILGKERNVLKFLVMNEYNKLMDAIYFGNVQDFIEQAKNMFGEAEAKKMFQNRDSNIKLSITYYPGINEFGGQKSIQAVIQNYKLSN